MPNKDRPTLTYTDYVTQAQKTSQPLNASGQTLRAILGLAGEVGELVDAYKKAMFQNRPTSEQDLLYELGDIHWYLADLISALQIDPNVVLHANLEKLRKRYPDGYSHERAAPGNRLDELVRGDLTND
jgi:NTP pyrophosphatase (non-canonical NTP hydrolase)